MEKEGCIRSELASPRRQPALSMEELPGGWLAALRRLLVPLAQPPAEHTAPTNACPVERLPSITKAGDRTAAVNTQTAALPGLASARLAAQLHACHPAARLPGALANSL
jgi:hypothetical protein